MTALTERGELVGEIAWIIQEARRECFNPDGSARMAARRIIEALADAGPTQTALLRTNSNLRAALLAAALAVETRTDVPPSTVQAWRETAT